MVGLGNNAFSLGTDKALAAITNLTAPLTHVQVRSNYYCSFTAIGHPAYQTSRHRVGPFVLFSPDRFSRQANRGLGTRLVLNSTMNIIIAIQVTGVSKG